MSPLQNTAITSREQSKSQNKENLDMKMICIENKSSQFFDQDTDKNRYSEKKPKEKEQRKRRTLLEKQTVKMNKIRGINCNDTSDEIHNLNGCNAPLEILKIDLSSLDGVDTKRASSKLLSTLSTRKPVVKSDRPATKPLHLGRLCELLRLSVFLNSFICRENLFSFTSYLFILITRLFVAYLTHFTSVFYDVFREYANGKLV